MYRIINPGEKTLRFGMVAKASGSAITTGTVNTYCKCLIGDAARAGKWFRDSDNTWQASETIALAATHQADGNWTVTHTNSPFTDAEIYLSYAKESGDLHVAAEGTLLTCRYDLTNIAGTVKTLDALITAIESYGDAHWPTATGFATPTNVTDARDAVKNYGDSHWATATGFATPTNLSDAASAIQDHGDSAWATATGFSTLTLADITSTGEKIALTGDQTGCVQANNNDGDPIPSNGILSAALEALAAHGDTTWATATGFATATNVSDAVTAIEEHGDGAWATATGFATPDDLDANETSITNHGDTHWSTAAGFATQTDITDAATAIEEHGDSEWATATGFATPADLATDVLDNTLRLKAVAAYNATNANTVTVVAHMERNGKTIPVTSMTAKIYDQGDGEKKDLATGQKGTRDVYRWTGTACTWVVAGAVYYIIVTAVYDGRTYISPPSYINT